MGTDSSLPSLAPLGALSSSRVYTTLPINGFANINTMNIANPTVSSVNPAVVVQSPHAWTPSSQTDVATLIEYKSTSHTHAYSRIGVIKPSIYSTSLLRSVPRPEGQGLGCAGCTAVHSLGIDHCYKHDGDKMAKGSISVFVVNLNFFKFIIAELLSCSPHCSWRLSFFWPYLPIYILLINV
jgi:hypothetical protein